LEDLLDGGRIAGDVGARLETEARALRRRARCAAGLVGGGVDVAVGVVDGEAERMLDRIGAEGLVIVDETGKDGEAGGVGASPRLRTAEVGVEGEDRSRSSLPAVERRVPVRVVELVEDPPAP